MLNKNSLVSGLILGTLIPIIGYVLLTLLYNVLEASDLASTEGFSPMFRERTTAIVAIGCNALLLNRFNALRFTESVRGVVIPTFIFVMVWIFYFKDIVLG